MGVATSRMGLVPWSQRPLGVPSNLLPCGDTARTLWTIYEPQSESSQVTESTGTLMLDFQPQGLGGINCCLQDTSLWFSVTAARMDYDNSVVLSSRIAPACTLCTNAKYYEWPPIEENIHGAWRQNETWVDYLFVSWSFLKLDSIYFFSLTAFYNFKTTYLYTKQWFTTWKTPTVLYLLEHSFHMWDGNLVPVFKSTKIIR